MKNKKLRVNSMSKLNWEKIKLIKKDAETMSQKEISNQYGVSVSTVSRILSGKIWSDESDDFGMTHRLSRREVTMIKESPLSTRQLARAFDVGASTISRIKRGVKSSAPSGVKTQKEVRDDKTES